MRMRRISLSLLHVGVMAAGFAVVAACGSDAGDPSTPGPVQPTEGAARGESCGSSQRCARGLDCVDNVCRTTCSSSNECEAGTACDGARLVCLPAACRDDRDCGAGERCRASACEAAPATACTPASVRCVGERLVICDPSGNIAFEEDCSATGVCIQRGSQASCADALCAPDSVACFGPSQVARCSADGQERTTERCPGGQSCQEGACVRQTCTPSSVTCSAANEVIACDDRGLRERVLQTCDAQGCRDGMCVSDATVRECQPGRSLGCYEGSEPSSALGPCNYGTRTCTAQGRWGPCEGARSPAEVSCVETLDCRSVRRTRAVVTQSVGQPLVAELERRGFAVQRLANINTDDLARADLLVGGTVDVSLSAPELRAWVSAGGSFFFYGAGNLAADCVILNTGLGVLGIVFDCSGRSRGPVTRVESHPSVRDLVPEELPFGVGTRLQRQWSGAGRPIVQVGSDVGAYAVELDCGRGVVWGSAEMVQAERWNSARGAWTSLLRWLESTP